MFLILFWPQYDLHPYRAKVMANSQRDRPMGNNHVTSPQLNIIGALKPHVVNGLPNVHFKHWGGPSATWIENANYA